MVGLMKLANQVLEGQAEEEWLAEKIQADVFADKFFLWSLENIKEMYISVPAAVGGW